MKQFIFIFSLFLGTSLIAQTFKLDVQFEVPFGKIDGYWERPIFNDLSLTQTDKDRYYKELISKIKDTTDYNSTLISVEAYDKNSANLLVAFAGKYYYTNQNGFSPTNTYNKSIITTNQVPVYDYETGQEAIDNDGYTVYRTDTILGSIRNAIEGVNSKEQWIINKKGFCKQPKATETILVGNSDYKYYDLRFLGFTQINSQKSSWKKKYIFKKDVAYNYFFFPSILKQNSLFPEEYDQVKLRDAQSSAINQNEAENLIKFIVNQLFKGEFKIRNNQGEEITFNEQLIKDVSLLAVVDQETGEFSVDENGDPIYEKEYVTYLPKDFAGIHFIEDWYFDAKKVGFFKKVKEIQLLAYSYNPEMEITGYESLPFTIVFE